MDSPISNNIEYPYGRRREIGTRWSKVWLL